MSYTIAFDEGAKGFTSFFSYQPDFMIGMNNDFFTVKDGQLYLHNDETNNVRNNFYNVQYNTEVTYIENSYPSEVKFAKAIKLEANRAVTADIKAYISDSDDSMDSRVSVSDFVDKEGMKYAYVRRNENLGNYTDKNVYGLGVVDNLANGGATLNFTAPLPKGSIAVGDKLIDTAGTVLSTIVSYTDTSITTDVASAVLSGDFIIGLKDARIEAGVLRGYNFEVMLTDTGSTKLEIYGSSLKVAKSAP